MESGQRQPPPICHICVAAPSKYTCPRCGIAYCSSSCYRSEKHSACSEGFYRDCCLEAMRGESVGSKERQAMVKVLQRQLEQEGEQDFYNYDGEKEEDNEAEEVEKLITRLESSSVADIDPDCLWKKLTPTEKRQFMKDLETGECAAYLPAHAPWWQGPVADPAKEPPLMPVKAGLLKSASPLMPMVLLEALLAYAYAMRLTNCDLADCPEQLVICCRLLWPTCCVSAPTQSSSALDDAAAVSLSSDAPPAHTPMCTVELTVARFLNRLQANASALGYSNSLFLACLQDASRLLSRESSLCYPERALSDLHTTLGRTPACRQEPTARRTRKRVEFLAAWLAQCQRQELQAVSLVLESAFCQYASSMVAAPTRDDIGRLRMP